MLDGKTVLVTGATSGIGRGVCDALLAAGAAIVAVGRNQEQLDELSRCAPSRVRPVVFDLTEFARYQEVFSPLGQIDGLVYSAGITDNNPLRFFSLDRYQRVVDINQTAPLALVSQLARTGQFNSGASIVLLASILGPTIGMKGTAAYAGTKGALLAFVKVMALELSNKLIRVNSVSPGMVNTPLIANQQQVSNQALQIDRQKYPLGKRYAEVGEVASLVRFLVSGESSFITGANIVVDGGFSIQ